jgi:hypothetical protein
MKIEPVGTQPTQTTVNTSNNSSAREKAIATLLGNQATTQPVVQDQNNISPEEALAVKMPGEAGQNDIKDETEVTDPSSSQKEEPISAQYAVLARK